MSKTTLELQTNNAVSSSSANLNESELIASPLQNKFRMHYQRVGSGNIALLCFHGYGQNEEVFLPLAKQLNNNDLCLISFSLPYHHKESSLGRKQELSPLDFLQFLKIVLRKEKIYKFISIGFSMGARFAVKAACLLPTQCLGTFAISPDGFKPSKWYKLVTQTAIGSSLLKHIIFKPSLFQSVLEISANLKLVPSSLKRFAISQMNTRPKRLKVYLSWMRFRGIQFSRKELTDCYLAHKLPLYVFAGSFDKIITTKNLQSSISSLPFVQLRSIPAGHQQMIEKSSTILISLLPSLLQKS